MIFYNIPDFEIQEKSMSAKAHNINKNIEIFGREKSRLFWSVTTLAALVGGSLLIFLYLFGTAFLSDHFHLNGELPKIIAFGGGGILMLLNLGFTGYMLKHLGFFQLNIFYIFALLLSAVAFLVNSLTNDLRVFDEFSTRTVIFLWLSFLALFLGLFRRKLPLPLLPLLSAFYVLGAAVSACFLLPMAGFMLFGWAFIPFMGIGLLPLCPPDRIISILVNVPGGSSRVSGTKCFRDNTSNLYGPGRRDDFINSRLLWLVRGPVV